jgi:hypothetical protein
MIEHEIPELDRAGLRKFGLTTGLIVIGLFGLLLPWLLDRAWPLWPWLLAGALCLAALVFPGRLAPVYRGWMRVGMALGYINTRIILFLLYYVVFVPVGLVTRIAGWDPMARAMTSPPDDSYRVMSRKRDRKHFERPY